MPDASKITEYIQKGDRKYIREIKAMRLRGKHHLTNNAQEVMVVQ
jgi:hypothetical protein